MDWGNAIVTSKGSNPTSGAITALTMTLHLEGDFKKTKKKITWLSTSPPTSVPLVDIELIDYDYLITKKKLEEGDNVDEFLTPVTEFRTAAFADGNVLGLENGDVIQFERKGYFILDAVKDSDGGKKLEFVSIPDGRAAGVASKAGGGEVVKPKEKESTVVKAGGSVLAGTKMYDVERIYPKDLKPDVDTKMYPIASLHD
jgi:glutamyl-tRNA synthetase